MPFCPKCGKENPEEAVFCSQCGQNLKATDKVVYRATRSEKNEKNEKDEGREKREKNEKNEGPGAMWGAVMGGLILLWLGVTFLLQQYNYLSSSNWWMWFVGGLGVILVLRGAMLYIQTSSWGASSGLMVGGAILIFIATASYMGVNEWWPFIFILLGAFVIFGAMMARKRTPRP